jgi:hypothetical protein
MLNRIIQLQNPKVANITNSINTADPDDEDYKKDLKDELKWYNDEIEKLNQILNRFLPQDGGMKKSRTIYKSVKGTGKANSTGPKAKSTGPKAKSTGPKAKSTGPKAKSTGPKAKSTGPKAKSTGPKAKSTGPKAKSNSGKIV